MTIKKEMFAVSESSKFLEKRVKDLTAENQMFLGQLMDLKEKQIIHYNEVNDQYEEVQRLKMKLELANIP
jgi:hypothetical protein